MDALEEYGFGLAHVGFPLGFHHQQGGVHLLGGFVDGFHHPVPQLALGGVETRGIHEDKLALALGQDADDPVPGGLGLGGHDGNLFPNEGIHNGGLAHVGPSQKRYGTAFFNFGHVWILSLS